MDGRLWQDRLYILQRELEVGKLHINGGELPVSCGCVALRPNEVDWSIV